MTTGLITIEELREALTFDVEAYYEHELQLFLPESGNPELKVLLDGHEVSVRSIFGYFLEVQLKGYRAADDEMKQKHQASFLRFVNMKATNPPEGSHDIDLGEITYDFDPHV